MAQNKSEKDSLISRTKFAWIKTSKSTKVAVMAGLVVLASGVLIKTFAGTITVGTLDAVTMQVTSGTGSVTKSKGFHYLKLASQDTTATGTITTSGPGSTVHLTAFGDQCNGAPQVKIMIDGTEAMLANVSSTSIATYSSDFAVETGTHTVTATFTNDFASGSKGKGCDRAVYLEKITVTGSTFTPGDMTAPSVAITAPTTSSTISGTVNVDADASDDTGVTKVELYDGSTLIGTSTTAPFGSSWNTTTAQNGAHILTAKAYDAAGNTGTSEGVDVTVANETSPPPTDDVYMPYSENSFFRKALPLDAPVDAVRTTSFQDFMKTHPDQQSVTWPRINTNENWAMSYLVGRASDPIWKLKGGNTDKSQLLITTTQGFHMADSVADTFPTGDQDRPGVMIDTVFGYTVQFADAVPDKATRTITVSSAGIMWHTSNALDHRNPKSNDQRNFTSRGRIIDAMVIRRDLLDKAVANNTGLGHVLHLFFVETNTADSFVHPMIGAEGEKYGWGAEGERIRLKPSVNLETRGLTGACLAVARTLQQHGGYLGDNSGSATQVKGSQAFVYDGTNLTRECMQGKVTWDDFEAIQRGYEP